MTKETRAGFVTIEIICGFLEEYIKSHTKGERYIGNPDYFRIYHSMQRYLNKDNSK